MFGSDKRGSVDVQPEIERDFVVRQIRQLADAIARLVLGRPATAELDQAEEALRAAARDALKVDAQLLDRLAAESARTLLATPARMAAYVEVLSAQAILARAAGDIRRADSLTARVRALQETGDGSSPHG